MSCGSWLECEKLGHEKPEQCHSSLSRKLCDRETLIENGERVYGGESFDELMQALEYTSVYTKSSWWDSLECQLCFSTL